MQNYDPAVPLSHKEHNYLLFWCIIRNKVIKGARESYG